MNSEAISALEIVADPYLLAQVQAFVRSPMTIRQPYAPGSIPLQGSAVPARGIINARSHRVILE